MGMQIHDREFDRICSSHNSIPILDIQNYSNMAANDNWVSKKVQGWVAGVGNAAGGAVNAVGNGVSGAGRGMGNGVSNTSRGWADSMRG
jgi:hypothetical protein